MQRMSRSRRGQNRCWKRFEPSVTRSQRQVKAGVKFLVVDEKLHTAHMPRPDQAGWEGDALPTSAMITGWGALTIRPLLLNSKPNNSADFFTRVNGPSSAGRK